MRSSNLVAVAVALTGCGMAHAQYRCDCTSVVDTCSANVVARGTFLEIKTDRPQCARVDYFVDGQPFVSVVVDGEDREDWLARTTAPRIMVQSCQVCRDSGPATAAAASAPQPTTSATGTADGDLQPLIASVPVYPEAARVRGVRGYVDVELTVTPSGRVENPHVVAAQPANLFDAAALAAVTRWRYPEDAAREPLVRTERIVFEPPPTAGRAVTPNVGPRNQCVREDAVYNYGDMVDVSLVNACPDPLVVFGCAEGAARDRGRWVCTDSETRGDVLVSSGDERIGRSYSAGSAGDLRTYRYAGSFSVTRAPNTRYWWVACTLSDTQCRADARQWVRSVGGQSTAADPQARSSIAVASSD